MRHSRFPKHSIFTLTLIILTPWMISCQQESPAPESAHISKESILHFTGPDLARDMVITDQSSNFFDTIQALDICVQLKIPNCPVEDLDSLRNIYRQFVAEDVMEFTPGEKEFLTGVIAKVRPLLDTLPPKLLPRDIYLIKTNGNYYGPSVFYTRDQAIVIPEPILRQRNRLGMKQVLLHEIFHIISRNHEDLRRRSYALIGFTPVEGTLTIPTKLTTRRLLNPDGMSIRWKIDLDSTNATQFHVPVVYSPVESFDPEVPSFFHYLSFDLFPLRNDSLITGADGLPKKSYRNDPVFRETITDNTGYIIHPDELMADNFVLLLTGLNNTDIFRGLTSEGRELLEEFHQVLQSLE